MKSFKRVLLVSIFLAGGFLVMIRGVKGNEMRCWDGWWCPDCECCECTGSAGDCTGCIVTPD